MDFGHVDVPTGGGSSSAWLGEPSITTPGPEPAPQPDYNCTACIWLRTGLQLVSSAPARLAVQACTTDLVLPVDTIWPDSPIPRPSAFRGPPPSFLA